ncbi:DUF2357 domain-containing protein [Engelhardtia mirabilis]|uniref:DUF2357 domain-containing protein n=1 Tax=Engelhardtia mirabilis TaxID=2528011 RepID=UPI0011AA1D88
MRTTSGNPEGAPERVVPAPEVTGGFREIGRYELVDPTGTVDAVVVDDEPLEPAPNARLGERAWRWLPGFYAGEVAAEARIGDRAVARFRLDVSPDPRKAGREVFDAMVDELWAEDPALVLGVEPATTRVGRLDAAQNPWIEFERLRRNAPAFLRALDEVVRRPRARLVAEREDRPAHRVRRVDRGTARTALRNPATLALLRPGLEAPTGAEPRFDVPRVTESLDSAANRALAALAAAALARTRSLLRVLERLALADDEESATRSALAKRWPERRRVLVGVERELTRRLRRQPFPSVRRHEVTSAGLVAVDADPAYARAWSCGWRALRRGIGGERNAERHWLSPTWEVYERWCFVRMARELRDEHAELAWTRSVPRDLHVNADAAWSGEANGRRLTILLQPRFPSLPSGCEAGPWSISKSRIPDIVVVDEADGRDLRFGVYDAKYRTARASLMDAMASAHIYRDSLRWAGQRVDGSVLLTPDVALAPELATTEYLDRHGCGGRPMLPDVATG